MHLRMESLDQMLRSPRVWAVARNAAWMFPGGSLHRAGLSALAAGAWEVADELFERASLRYREELRIEPLARLRVHQAIGRARWAGAGGPQALPHVPELLRDIEQAIGRLDRIESLRPPFDMADARDVLAEWQEDLASPFPHDAARDDVPTPRLAA